MSKAKADQDTEQFVDTRLGFYLDGEATQRKSIEQVLLDRAGQVGQEQLSKVAMKIIYSCKFTHCFELEPIKYKFTVYRTYTSVLGDLVTPVSCDFICEFVGLEALNRYETVQNATPEQLQQYLYTLSKQEYVNKQTSLAITRAQAHAVCARAHAACTQAQTMCTRARTMRNRLKEAHSSEKTNHYLAS